VEILVHHYPRGEGISFYFDPEGKRVRDRDWNGQKKEGERYLRAGRSAFLPYTPGKKKKGDAGVMQLVPQGGEERGLSQGIEKRKKRCPMSPRPKNRPMSK